MPATVVPEADVDIDDVTAGFWVSDRMPASAMVADRVLGTCRAAGCASPVDRRPARWAHARQVNSTRRTSR
jgi:hypothetical protein